MVKSNFLYFCVAALAAAAPSSLGASTRAMRVVILKDPVRPPYGWGTLAVWTRITVRADSGRRRILFLPYLGEQHVLPKRGERCIVKYRQGTVRGWVEHTPMRSPRALIIKEINCKSANLGS
jgi:hypothetical protein